MKDAAEHREVPWSSTASTRLEPRPRLRVVYFGRADYFAELFVDAIRAEHELIGIVEARFGQRGAPGLARSWLAAKRGRFSLRDWARRQELPYFYLARKDHHGLAGFLDGLASELGFIASLPQLLPPRIIARFGQGVINYHPALLPAYRGPCPQLWTYYFCEPEGGVTLHFIDAGEDTGDIIAQRALPIGFAEPVAQLERRSASLAAELLRQTLNDVAARTVERRPQRHLPCPFRARFVQADEVLIDWQRWPLSRVFHLLRGASPAFNLTPTPPFPWSLLSWTVDRLEKGSRPGTAPGVPYRHGLRWFVGHPEGRISLVGRWAARHALRTLWQTARHVLAGP